MTEVVIDVEGLELRGFHGALPEEKKSGQRFLFDVQLVAHDVREHVEALTAARAALPA